MPVRANEKRRLESTGHIVAGFGRSAGVRNVGGMLCV